MNFDHSMFVKIISGRHTGAIAAAIRFFLAGVSLVYRVAIRFRNWAYDHGFKRTHRIDAPVISIGNLTAGGTGKTPFVIWLANQLKNSHQTAIISRGYGSTSEQLNDEGLEIQQRLPGVLQIQNADRVMAARKCVGMLSKNRNGTRLSPVVLLDDGFQHRRLARNTDIVLIDSTCPFGYDFLIPRGLLREPVASINRADLAILTRADLVSAAERSRIKTRLRLHNPELNFAEAEVVTCGLLTSQGREHSVDLLDGQRLFAFCGIGNPDGFLNTLRNQNLQIAGSRIFDDHFHYRAEDLRDVFRQANQLECDSVVCTHKDLVKLNFEFKESLPVYALLTELRITAGSEFVDLAIEKALPELKKSRRNEAAEALAHG